MYACTTLDRVSRNEKPNNYLENLPSTCATFGDTPLAIKAFVKDTPTAPPITPPIACNPAQPKTPPHLVRAAKGMKNDPMNRPATAAEDTETANRKIDPKSLFSNKRLYPNRETRTSNMMQAAVKPKKWKAVGLNIKFIIVAMQPTNVAVPIFLTYHTANIMAEKPIKSQQKGK